MILFPRKEAQKFKKNDTISKERSIEIPKELYYFRRKKQRFKKNDTKQRRIEIQVLFSFNKLDISKLMARWLGSLHLTKLRLCGFVVAVCLEVLKFVCVVNASMKYNTEAISSCTVFLFSFACIQTILMKKRLSGTAQCSLT